MARNRRSCRRTILTLIVLLATMLPAQPAAALTDVGYPGLPSGGGSPTGTKRAESVMWWNDGFWWANMYDTSTTDFHIFRLNTGTQTWVNTGVVTDGRPNTHSDVLWDQSTSKLYVASHTFVSDEVAAVSGYPSYLYRFSYNATTDTYTRDSGFPEQINNMKTETLVIDKDSTGQLWATWQQANQIYVNRTTSGDRTWGTPFPLPVSGSAVTVDDISSVVAFGGNKIGVMWSNQGSTDAMYFAVHHDSAADSEWEASRTAFQGTGSADDHINLKSLSAAGGRVYAMVKTSFSSSAQPLIMLFVRDPATGNWDTFPVSRVSDCPNRPSLLIDEQNAVLHVFFTAPGPPGYSCSSSGGAIYEKTSPLEPTSAISFPTGAGTPLIMDADSPYMNNASSTKQNINATTNMAVLAVNSATDRYWHSYQTIPGGTASAPVASFTATPTSGQAPLAVQFTDTSTNSPTSWSWNLGDGTTSTSRNPSHTYSAAGTYSVTLTASNSAGSSTSSPTTITVSSASAAPVASFTATPTSGQAPLAVQFTDTSTNSPTSWRWNFGDGTTSTSQHPSHTYSAAGTYSVSLTASNSAGSSTSSPTTITVSPPPAPVASFTAAQASTPPLTMNFTDTSTNGPTSWSWNFGDGTTSTSQNPSHTYSAAGTYNVTLTAANSSGSSTTSKSVLVVAAPVASFTATPTSGQAPLAVQFTDTSTNSPTSWSWNFGDGTTSTSRNPSHTYSSAGNHQVRLTVSNAGGTSTSSATTISVTDFDISVTPSSQTVVAGRSVTYQVTVTAENGFSGTVSLSLTGLPSGVTASFSPNPTSSSAVLTVTTTSSAKIGNHALRITGTSGPGSHSTTATLRIKRK